MELAIELRSLVHESVALLGQVIQRELGLKDYQDIENIRKKMVALRKVSDQTAFKHLQKLTQLIKKRSPAQRYQIAHAYTLMLELMNTSENAYRHFRLQKRIPKNLIKKPDSITYVLTAHPTEARSPKNIEIFHQIQDLLIEILSSSRKSEKISLNEMQKNDLFHLLEIAWRTPAVRPRSPKVKDEAHFIYSQIFRKDILFSLIDSNQADSIPFFLHSWVGGDKDGHPGVNDKTLLQSLTLSRGFIIDLLTDLLNQTEATFDLSPQKELRKQLIEIKKLLRLRRRLHSDDLSSVISLNKKILQFDNNYQTIFGSQHPQVRRIRQVVKLFPALVIPLELRESSDILMLPPQKPKPLAIERMLFALAKLAGSQDPKCYARCFIVSMTETVEHLKAAAQKQQTAFGSIPLPIVPLFEEASSLAESELIMQSMLQDRKIKSAIKKNWNNSVQMMVGYSDSSKDAGVLPSRLGIAEALPRLEAVCLQHKVRPLFFHGSGGSVDRGGGNIEDQMTWWPRTAVSNYKVTLQGEMIERSLATPEISQRQLEKIAASASLVLTRKFKPLKNHTLDAFAEKIKTSYRQKITAPEFINVVERATPYSSIQFLKIGSRPSKRTQELTVKGLRAIPWILCWTQTRLLLPTWWGVGQAWSQATASEKKKLKSAFKTEAAFTSYVKALDFTLAKIELPIFKIYLEQSGLDPKVTSHFLKEVELEYAHTVNFCKSMTGSKEHLFYKRWLKESIDLRAPMIHPLNILQVLAQKERDLKLLRLTVTGISSGMMATG